MYAKVKNLAYKFWNSEGRKVAHTFWEAGVPVLISQLVLVKSSADVKGAFIVAGATALAAVKAILVSPRS